MNRILEYSRQKSCKLSLGGGKQIFWNEWGSPNGFPLLHFHGANGSRLEGIEFDTVCKKHDIRLITPDRPGCGDSTLPLNSEVKYRYNFESYMRDISALLDHLNIDTQNFGIHGVSQGATFTMGALRFLRESRFYPRFGILWNGLPLTPSKLLYNDARYQNAVSQTVMNHLKNSETYKEMILRKFQQYMILYGGEKAMENILKKYFNELELKELNKNMTVNLENENVTITKMQLLMEDNKLSMKNGTSGADWGFKITSNDTWGFNLGDIDKNMKIHMFYAKHDGIIPIEWSKLYKDYLIDECGLNNIQCVEFDDCGHFASQESTEKAFTQIRKSIDDLQVAKEN